MLFGCFVTTLNDTFEMELVQEHEGYDSGSENFNIPTPLSRALRIYHVSMVDDLSFNPANSGCPPMTPEQQEVFILQTQMPQPHMPPSIHQP